MCETRIFMHTFNLNSISQMKKKIFSALLMGVFTLASMSMFVSCKDYDDDINNLDAGQQELLSRLEALEGEVNTNYTDLSGQLATAVENANKALQGSNDALAALEEVRTTASAAGTAAANAQTTAEGAQEAAEDAQKTADEALQKAEDALKAIGVDESGVSLVEKVADLENRVASLEALKETIPTLIEQAQKATNEQLKALNEQVAKYEAFFDNLFAMLTSVDLYGTFSGSTFNTDAAVAGSTPATGIQNLAMLHGNVGKDSKFGDDEALQIDNKTVFATATSQITFVKNADIKVNEGVIVRVNPVNAQITGDNVAIKVIDSQGNDMSEFIKVADVEPFTDLLVTRAGNVNTGLYKINFEWVDGVDMTAYGNRVKGKDKTGNYNVLFAVAINNTDTVRAERYVTSTYDLTLGDKSYVAARELSYTVNDVNVKDLRNRWKYITAKDKGADAYEEVLTGSAVNAVERVWVDDDPDGVRTPDTKMVASGSGINVREATGADNESRYQNKYLPVEVGVPFTVELDANTDKIQYYYVTLDENFAGVSAPSELVAWKNYEYDGLYTMTDATKPLNITVKSLDAAHENGDRIGFRVFAVNYDGTLVDPDGRAFYVAVGNEATAEAVDVNLNAWLSPCEAIKALPSTFKPVSSTDKLSGTGTTAVTPVMFGDPYNTKSTTAARIGYQLCKDDKGNAASNWTEAKYIKVWFNNPQYFLDDATFSFVIAAHNTDGQTGVDRVVNTLTVNVTKVMPNKDNVDVTFKENQLVNGVYTCYLDAPTWNNPVWNATASTGVKNLWNYVTGINESEDFVFTFANAAKDPKNENKYTAPLEVTATAAEQYIATVDKDLIDGKTQHATTIACNYNNISCQLDKDGVPTPVAVYPVNVIECQTVFACPVNDDVLTYEWKQRDVTDKDGNVIGKEDVNWITYDAEFPCDFTNNGTLFREYLKAMSAVDPKLYAPTGFWKGDMYQVSTLKATLTSNGTGKEDYFTLTYNETYNTFVFHTVSGATNPTADVASTLTITAKDAFGHDIKIELPFTVKRSE